MKIKAIRTLFAGFAMRSRLEARYAVLFDRLGVEWDYETEGFDLGGGVLYLPDFLLHQSTNRPRWVEIKPTAPSELERGKMISLVNSTKRDGVILYGTPEQDETGQVKAVAYAWTPVSDPGLETVYSDPDFYGKETSDAIIANGGAARLLNGFCYGDLLYGNLTKFSEIDVKVDNAILAARSARFEHGETPRLRRPKRDGR